MGPGRARGQYRSSDAALDLAPAGGGRQALCPPEPAWPWQGRMGLVRAGLMTGACRSTLSNFSVRAARADTAKPASAGLRVAKALQPGRVGSLEVGEASSGL